MGTDQVPEVLGDHELERLGRARRITRNHRVARHDLAHGRRVWVKPLRGDLQAPRQHAHQRHAIARRRTLYARSFAVKIPLRPSSSSTTRTQSVRFAAHSWLASATLMCSGTVSAGLGFSAATVPFVAVRPARLPGRPLCVVEIVRLRASSDSIFLRIACVPAECQCRQHRNRGWPAGCSRRDAPHRAWTACAASRTGSLTRKTWRCERWRRCCWRRCWRMS